MNLRSVLSALALSAALSGAAFAADLEWEDGDSGYPLWTLTLSNPTYGGTFDLTLDGFDPDTMTITSATASFAFADDNSDWKEEYVDIKLNGGTVVDDYEFDGSHANPPSSYDWVEVVLDQPLIDVLQQDGTLSYLVKLQNTYRADGYLKVVKLTATGHDNPPPSVPDSGATSLLIGLGLACMAAVRKHLTVRK